METYLITGATGFVGGNVARALVEKNKQVAVLVRDKKLSWRLSDIAKKLAVYTCDLLDASLPSVIAEIKPTHIFHFASYGSLPMQDNEEKMIDINIRGVNRLINAIKRRQFKLFVNTGSSSEYGIKDKPMREIDMCEPVNTYGITKLSASLFCQKVAIRETLPIVTFRLFSPYGYYEQKERLIPSIIKNALENSDINISSPSHVRDFIFIEDVVSAYIKAAERINKLDTIINIGSGKQYTVRDIVEIISTLTNSKSSVHFNTVPAQARQIEPAYWQANIEKTKTNLAWLPQYTIREGLKKTIGWFIKHKNMYG